MENFLYIHLIICRKHAGVQAGVQIVVPCIIGKWRIENKYTLFLRQTCIYLLAVSHVDRKDSLGMHGSRESDFKLMVRHYGLDLV